MTIIAKLTPSGLPLFLGDLLLSTGQNHPSPVFDHFPLATVGPGMLDPRVGTRLAPKITGLVRKICIPRDNLLVAWAGNRVFARAVINDLVSHLDTVGYSQEAIEYFFNHPIYPEVNKPSFIIALISESDISYFWQNTLQAVSASFGDMYLAGSGSGDAMDFINQCDSSDLKNIMTSTPDDLMLSIAAAKVLSMTGTLIGREMHTGQSIDSFFGGGYEIHGIVDGKFWRMEEVTYMFYNYPKHLHGTRNIIITPAFIKMCFADQHLILRRLYWSKEIMKTLDSILFDRHPPHELLLIVQPIVGIPESEYEIEIKYPELKSEWTCHYIMLGDNHVVALACHDMDGVLVNFTEQTIEFSPEFTDVVFSQLDHFTRGLRL